MRFKTGDYKAAFAEEVEKLAGNNVPDRSKRMQMINDLIEEYVEDTGKRPDNKQLTELTNAILYEDLEGDTRPNKSTLEESPILTDNQYDRRQNSELYGSKSEILLDSIGSDGQTHTAPTRTNKELSRNLQKLKVT
jgi:hypothetical protein